MLRIIALSFWGVIIGAVIVGLVGGTKLEQGINDGFNAVQNTANEIVTIANYSAWRMQQLKDPDQPASVAASFNSLNSTANEIANTLSDQRANYNKYEPDIKATWATGFSMPLGLGLASAGTHFVPSQSKNLVVGIYLGTSLTSFFQWIVFAVTYPVGRFFSDLCGSLNDYINSPSGRANNPLNQCLSASTFNNAFSDSRQNLVNKLQTLNNLLYISCGQNISTNIPAVTDASNDTQITTSLNAVSASINDASTKFSHCPNYNNQTDPAAVAIGIALSTTSAILDVANQIRPLLTCQFLTDLFNGLTNSFCQESVPGVQEMSYAAIVSGVFLFPAMIVILKVVKTKPIDPDSLTNNAGSGGTQMTTITTMPANTTMMPTIVSAGPPPDPSSPVVVYQPPPTADAPPMYQPSANMFGPTS